MVVRHMTPCPDALRGAAPMRPYRGCHGRVVRKVGKYADEARLGLWGGLQVCDHSDARMVVRGEREREREGGRDGWPPVQRSRAPVQGLVPLVCAQNRSMTAAANIGDSRQILRAA